MRLSFAILGALAMAAPIAASPAHAQAFINGSRLATACAARNNAAEENACNGYLAGTLDAIASNPELKSAVCPPPGVKLVALREAMGKFGQSKPEATKGSGVDLVIAMVKANYPCPGK